MICDVQYGGRITDDFDRTCFRAYTTAWMNAAILEANFRFYDIYRIPFGMEVEAYRKYIDDLPLAIGYASRAQCERALSNATRGAWTSVC